MKCLLLGGGGFLGSHLCDALLGKEYHVKIFERPNLQRYRVFAEDENLEWVEGDFNNQEDIAAAVSGCNIIYHFVSTTIPKSSNDNPVYDVETNVVGTLNLLETACLEKIKKVIFISSGGTVYGLPLEIPITENHPTNPICAYGISKLAIEKYLYLYKKLHGLEYCILRMSNPFGERQRETAAQGAVSVFLYQALMDSEITVWGDGSVVRDYIYVENVVDAMVRAASYQGETRIFNIGSGRGTSLNEIIGQIEDLIGRTVKIRYTPGRSLDVPVNILDIERASVDLQWSPDISLRQGLEGTLRWLAEKYSIDF